MNYIIDTHILLWYMEGNSRISTGTQEKIEDASNTILISNASLWEMAVKVSIGKLALNGSLKAVKNYLDEKGFHLLEFDADDLDMLQTLPFHHQDPFERLIVAQTKAKSLEIISDDWQVNKYFE